jgi:hypothetical protein
LILYSAELVTPRFARNVTVPFRRAGLSGALENCTGPLLHATDAAQLKQ